MNAILLFFHIQFFIRCIYPNLKSTNSTKRLSAARSWRNPAFFVSPIANCKHGFVEPILRCQHIPIAALQFSPATAGANIIWTNHIVDGKNSARVRTKRCNESTHTLARKTASVMIEIVIEIYHSRAQAVRESAAVIIHCDMFWLIIMRRPRYSLQRTVVV